ncbi:MAG: AAA family ATPase [Patescibacteria group bacterium]|jgi:chromosome segregation protein
MFLEKLEIQGFKSFASKNALVFPGALGDKKGITVIVGPNGSGKSNIADAVRWVLGEQSMKTLRAKTGEDVIFSGSANKGQLGMAEVSIFLNNEDGQAPIEFSQLAITRRLYRSGESEYLINGAKVRLSDIQILLARANIGQKTYSIIGQGMVESFLATTASERKEFFDEATGIRQFQIKREQSLNKLIGSYENLGQANLLLAEIEPRLKSLTRQVSRLRQKGEIEIQLKDTRTIYFKYLWHKLNDKLKEYNEKYLGLEETLRKKSVELEKQNEELGKMENENRSEELTPLTEEANLAQRQREETLKKIATVQAELSLELESSGEFDLSWLINKESELKENIIISENDLTLLKKDCDEKIKEGELFIEEKKRLNEKVQALTLKLKEQSALEKSDKGSDQEIADRLENLRNILIGLENENELSKIKEALIAIKTLVREISELRGGHVDNPFYAEERKIQEELLAISQEKEIWLEKEKDHTLKIRILEEKIRLTENELNKKRSEIKSVSEKISHHQNKKDNTELKDRLGKLEVELKDADAKIFATREKINELNRQTESKRTRLFQLQREGQLLQNEINNFNNELGIIKIEAAKYETRLENLENDIRQVLENIREIRDQRSTETINEEEVAAQIKNLENQHNLIGGIDPEVEKEYVEIKQKYDFLHEQTTDLESAIGSLEGIIRELDAQIKVRFEKEFKEICKKFEEYFKILFGGGTAKLLALHEDEIEAGEKPVEADNNRDELREKIKKLSKYNATGLAGIEIQACPPGKIIKTINVLSGGEKALTAIALICAIISANPSPFVFLDEVDAALDESNSERLAKILDDLSHKTQFIAITHNRAPMRRANVLYGVTMQENGVSKLLSIKLEDYIKE